MPQRNRIRREALKELGVTSTGDSRKDWQFLNTLVRDPSQFPWADPAVSEKLASELDGAQPLY